MQIPNLPHDPDDPRRNRIAWVKEQLCKLCKAPIVKTLELKPGQVWERRRWFGWQRREIVATDCLCDDCYVTWRVTESGSATGWKWCSKRKFERWARKARLVKGDTPMNCKHWAEIEAWMEAKVLRGYTIQSTDVGYVAALIEGIRRTVACAEGRSKEAALDAAWEEYINDHVL